MKKGQISFEYLILVGFITFVIIGILAIALFYSGTIKGQIKITEMNNFANKIISASESVFYAGSPSKATISVYLPENVESVEINEAEGSLIIAIQTSSGITKSAFYSNVPISGTLNNLPGLKRIQIQAQEDKVIISQV